MSPADQKKDNCAERRPPFECTALLLQGGGALGAYQAGVYEALSEAGIHPDWVAGISIGAVNSAIIAGNPLKSGWKDCAGFGNALPPMSAGVGRRIS
jgi:NTE family protein